MESNKKIGIALGAVAVVAIAGISIAKHNGTDTAQTQPVEATPIDAAVVTATTTDEKSTSTVAMLYKDGTYSATGSYMSPGGLDKLGVTLTLKGDIVTDANVTEQAGDRTSTRYQEMFISGYKQYVIGKNISNISVTKVSGSSLTSKGFNDALAQIKTQAAL